MCWSLVAEVGRKYVSLKHSMLLCSSEDGSLLMKSFVQGGWVLGTQPPTRFNFFHIHAVCGTNLVKQ